MPQTRAINRQIVLQSRPQGAPSADNFKMQEVAIAAPEANQVLLRTLYLSLDPYMRGRMSDAASYAPPVALGEVMVGGTVARVEVSQHADFKAGDLVLSQNGWQDYAISDGQGLNKLAADMQHPSLSLGVLGMPGFTAYMGLLDIGLPLAGETVVVAAASGAVGSVVGQIAKLHGCKVVGLAGGAEKCDYVLNTLGFDACIDHQHADFATELAASCGAGIDVYFESVGGKIFDAVLPLLNARARVPVCGLIAHYNDTAAATGNSALLMRQILTKRIKMQGFIIFEDYAERYPEFFAAMSAWLKADKIKFKEDVVQDLSQAPQAFIGLLAGANFGKLVVHIAD